ncbi:MAG TPA: hypothetical protein DEW46_07610 [Verrucomicrobia bacterium]|nr:hypothetical protein [Verrucomicrobiota bacterium]
MNNAAPTRTPRRPPMVVLDARWIFPEISGIGAYTIALLRAWSAQTAGPIRLRAIFDRAEVMRRTLETCQLAGHPWIETELVPYSPFSWRSQIQLPRLLRAWDTALFHAPNYLIPLLGRTPIVATIHDLIPLKFPHFTPKARKTRILPLYRGLMRQVARRCSAILTDSETSAEDIRSMLLPQRSQASVHPIHCGVDRRFLEAPAPTPPASPPYRLLYVGRSDPYKNIIGLVRTLEILRRDFALDVHLTLVSRPDPRYPEAGTLMEHLGLTPYVTWTGPLSDHALLDAYRSHHCLLHLSRYEGFGLPVLEAMACGLPVVSSHAGSLAEVIGDAAPTVAPDDIEEAAHKVHAILTQPELAARQAQEGRKRAELFRWEKTAAATLAVYRELIDANQDRIARN